MKNFIHKNFLLQTDAAKELYHEHAKKQPIIDYHCHISPKEIYENRRFDTIYQIWLGGDHYKWRLMRANGVEETYITGESPEREKFQKFAETLPRAIGNPMYHWCHLELKMYFGYDGILNGDTAGDVWQHCNKKLAEPDMSARSIIRKSNVEFIGTTDDPTDDLMCHKKIADDNSFDCEVRPTFRPDKALNIEKPDWNEYITKLEAASGISITDAGSLQKALRNRMEFFHQHGCKMSDHGFDYLPFVQADKATIDCMIRRARNGESISAAEADAFKTYFLLFCAESYYQLGWVQQYHFNCQRNPNSRMFKKLGADAGFDIPNTVNCSAALTSLLDELYKKETLPKTVLYSLNPADNIMLATTAGSFQGTEARGKIQHGSAWWFNDTKQGMIDQMTTLASVGLLGNFVGMTTDSRSFLSYARHDYFRRILCQLIGDWVDAGEYPNDTNVLASLVQDICYNNIRDYLDIA